MLNCVIIPRYLTTYVNAGEHFAQFNWIKYFSFIYLPSDQMISYFVFVVHTFQLHSPLSICKLKAFRYNRMIPMTSITKHFFSPLLFVIHRLLLSHVPKHCWSRQYSPMFIFDMFCRYEQLAEKRRGERKTAVNTSGAVCALCSGTIADLFLPHSIPFAQCTGTPTC